MNSSPITIFLVDDDSDDQEVFSMLMDEICPRADCVSAGDGNTALEILLGDPPFTPQFIFLDINMPGMNGMECLREIKKTERLREIPVYMYSTSREEAIVSRYEAWRANKLSPFLGRLTGVGAMRGIELINADGTPASAQLTQLLALARDAGLLLMPSGKSRHIIRLLAPLTTEAAVLEEGLDIFEACLAKLS